MRGRSFLRHFLPQNKSNPWDDDDHWSHGHGWGRPVWWKWWGGGGGHTPKIEPAFEFNGVDDYRSIDGTGNNALNTDWGAAHTQFLRLTPNDYGDGINTPSGAGRPSAREISNEIFAQDSDVYNETGASNMLWVWGQFLDHDIDLAKEGGGEFFPISVPTGDPHFDPLADGGKIIPLSRSGFDPATGTDASNPREQINEITSFIDASNVYGSDAARAAFLRADGGKLKVSDGDYLPSNDGTFPNAGPGGDSAFLAGDVRANENVALTSMHTIFVREHNRLVDEFADAHPDWSADKLYEEAKAVVEAEMQVITYKEFLPLLLGDDTLAAYSGYKADVDPGIANEFAGAAFRVGHTMLSALVARMEEDGSEAAAGDLALRDAFFSQAAFLETGPDAILRGMSATMAQEIDTQVIDGVRNFLFGPPGSGGFDLVSLNIQRGRDHGLPDYNTAREYYGLDPVTSFAEITSDTDLQAKLFQLYGNVDNIDLFVGGLAEDHVQGAMVGELVLTILADQFTRLRDGDSFWYEQRFDEDEIRILEETTLSDIIMRNSDVDHLQYEALMASERIGGDDGKNVLLGDGGRDLMIGFDGNDKLFGFGDTDDLFGDEGNDMLFGGTGGDYLHGGDGRDMLFGQAGNDMLWGDAGKDKLFGGSGDDILMGGTGNDWLTGGSGQDMFVIKQEDVGTGIDYIKDMLIGVNGDTLDLSDVLPGVDPGDLDDYVGLFEMNGDTHVKVDAGGSNPQQGETVAVLEGVTNVDLDQLVVTGNIVV